MYAVFTMFAWSKSLKAMHLYWCLLIIITFRKLFSINKDFCWTEKKERRWISDFSYFDLEILLSYGVYFESKN